MRIAEFIRRNADPILEESEVFARSALTRQRALSDDFGEVARRMLERIADCLEGQNGSEVGLPDDDGPGPGESVLLLRALRAGVLGSWARTGSSITADQASELLEFNHLIDQAIVETVALEFDPGDQDNPGLADRRTWQASNQDPLTGLPNRELFLDRLELEMKHAARSGEALAVLYLDLDRSRDLETSFGRQAGDTLIRRVAERIAGCVRKDDTVGRIGRDDFTVLLTGLQQVSAAGDVAQKILGAFAVPFQIGEHPVQLSCNIGIATYPRDADDPEVMLRNADQARYAAREAGRNRVNYFDLGRPGSRLN